MCRYGYYIAQEVNITIYLRPVVSFVNLNHVALRRNPKVDFFMVAMVTMQDAQLHLAFLPCEDYGL